MSLLNQLTYMLGLVLLKACQLHCHGCRAHAFQHSADIQERYRWRSSGSMILSNAEMVEVQFSAGHARVVFSC